MSSHKPTPIPALEWLLAGIFCATAVAWFSEFPLREDFAAEQLVDIFLHFAYCGSAVLALLLLRRLKSPLLDLGWSVFALAAWISLLDEFTYEPALVGANYLIEAAPEGLLTVGLVLMTAGFWEAEKAWRRQLGVTEQAEANAREAEQRFRRFTETVQAIPWEYDISRDRFAYVGPQLRAILGVSPESWSDMASSLRSIVEQDRDRVRMARARAIDDGAEGVVEYRARASEGELVFLREWFFASGQGSTNRLLRGFVHDVTDRRRIEAMSAELAESNQQLHEQRRRAQASAEAKTRFLSDVSHEIRAPLAVIREMAELLASQPRSASEQQSLTRITDSAKALIHVVDDVVDVSRVESGRITLADQEFQPAAVVWQVVEAHQQEALRRGLELQSTTPQGLSPTVWGDPLRLRQILSSLVVNALGATPGGRVTVELETDDGAEGRLGCLFRVSDTGAGIPPDRLPPVFQDSSSGDPDVDPRFDGPGLGMSTARSLVELMGGQIQEESEEGAGSTVACRIVFDRFVAAAPTASQSELSS